MRKINMITVMLMLVLLLMHGIVGVLQMVGLIESSLIMRIGGFALLGVVAIHAIISTILTIQTLYAIHKSGASYFKENKLFWLRRISGYVIIILIVFHVVLFFQSGSESVRLSEFNVFALITQILLVISIAIHVISNVKPTLIAFGIRSFKDYAVDILLVLTFVLIFFIIGFIIYYIRWKMV